MDSAIGHSMPILGERGMPFVMHLPPNGSKRTLGIANGKYKIPDDIDESNDAIAEMFGVNQA